MIRDRIKQIIEEKELKYSSFADMIKVSRGTISHILGEKERNEPSAETIDKILKCFTDISPSWLLQGDGPMYITERVIFQPDIFGENTTVESSVKPQGQEYPPKNEDKKPENKTDSPHIKTINLSNITAKKIDKIIFFFNDKTFATYIPEE